MTPFNYVRVQCSAPNSVLRIPHSAFVLFSVALLELLAASAGAGIITAHDLIAYNRLGLLRNPATVLSG